MMGWPTDPHGLWLEIRAGKVSDSLAASLHRDTQRLILLRADGRTRRSGAEERRC